MKTLSEAFNPTVQRIVGEAAKKFKHLNEKSSQKVINFSYF